MLQKDTIYTVYSSLNISPLPYEAMISINLCICKYTVHLTICGFSIPIILILFYFYMHILF